jgi:aspartate aminotransferase-like enzyme
MNQKNVAISGGHAHLKDVVLRLSNMGDLTNAQVLRGIQTIGESLQDCGIDVNTDSAVNIAENTLNY